MIIYRRFAQQLRTVNGIYAVSYGPFGGVTPPAPVEILLVGELQVPPARAILSTIEA